MYHVSDTSLDAMPRDFALLLGGIGTAFLAS
jgi:hypothetical protein